MGSLDLAVREQISNPVAATAIADSELSEFLDILKPLIREPSVVGNEDSFFRVLQRELQEVGVDVSYYHGILVAQGSRPQDLFLSAHIDRHGLLCTGPNEFQYAAFIAGNQGEVMGDSVSEHMLHTIEDRFQGQRVQAHLPYTGTYLGQGEITRSYICPERKNLIFEVSGLDFLQPGTPISFLDRLQIAGGCISAQLDNVLSAAIIIYLFRQGFQGTGLFTAQEESGRSWRYALSWFQRQNLTTQRLVVLDTSPYATREDADAQQIALRHRDANGPFAEAMTQELAGRCNELGLTYGFKDEYIAIRNQTRSKPYPLGRTELGRIVTATEGAINGTTLQIPTTEYHTATETASLSAIAAVIELLKGYIAPE
ncbi:MAG: peptidase M42 [Leptolyngbyaceae cyanobacterium SM1_1_3]|nr:peptidase M42 [Leptolyngbyaceae cyanobacterium SM1_1_3]NJN02667.1 peptidase M42 [Leptolyngbyaceae cyanobacterium RM1_1_2]NJO11184.1 peptidase M42 [Leptolyngbyaceae cyanobacterium SL_1_1]